jgi:hypothetical protein
MNENEIVMNEYHGIIVEESLTDKALLSRMKILGKRFYQKNDFLLCFCICVQYPLAQA